MVVLTVKPTRNCNASCTYCDEHENGGGLEVMSPATLEVLFTRIGAFMAEEPDEDVELLWHGGEPLLAGPDFYHMVAKLQAVHCSSHGDRIRHGIQTNLTCFRAEFVGALRELGILHLGTSYDPEPGIRGLGPKRSSAAYGERFFRALRLLEAEGFIWGLVYVVTRHALRDPLAVFLYLTNLVGQGGLSLNPVISSPHEPRDTDITPGDYVGFLGAIYPFWLENRHRYPNVEPFCSISEDLVAEAEDAPWTDPALGHILVRPSGETESAECGRSAARDHEGYGNLHDVALRDILATNAAFIEGERRRKIETSACRECRHWQLCRGGGVMDSFSQNEPFMGACEWCAARGTFVEQHVEPLLLGSMA